MEKFRFAIMGAGLIANKFCDAVKKLENCEIVAVSSKSMERASRLALQNDILQAYDSYERMLEQEHPDCVYIAVTSNAHYDLCMLCLDYKVPVLCEKAMFLNSTEAKTVFERSRQLQVFVMEAMWSRFLPNVRIVKKWLEEGRIGIPSYAEMTIGFRAARDPSNRYYNMALGGGAAFDITVYAYEITTYLLEEPIEEIQVNAVWADTGVDLTDHITLRFPHMLASLNTSFAADLEDRLVIYGDKGKIVLPNPHHGSEAFLCLGNQGEITEHFRDEETQNGFVYEIREAMECIRTGRTESAVVPHSLTVACSELFDMIMALKTK